MGTATASHQVEGNNTNNNWHAWEEAGHTVHKSGLAADWWGGRWREDFDRAAETGQNAHRFSLEWSRIQPTPDTWDEEAIEKYRLMLRGLRERNLTALVTLHHFTDPLWVTERGGWENPEIVGLFEKFTRKVVDALKEYNTLWCTINEPNVYTMSGYVQGAFPPGKKDLKLSMRVMGNMVRAHAAAYRAIHELQPESRVGYALHYRPMVPRLRWSPLDRLMRNIRYEGLNMAFPSAILTGVMRSPIGNQNIPEAKGTQDYLGLNYYSVDTVWFDLFKPGELFSNSGYPKNADMSDTNFIANIPEGIFNSIKWIERTYPTRPSSSPRTAWKTRRSHAPALPCAAPSSDLARGQLQLACEGIFPLVIGRQLRMGTRLDSTLRPLGSGR
ncbi:family 1 glycosylhydrolase [Candidatus Villigracilis affinis]|uniref:family 1 glycosylhydrolase n=1 Tax=Candidatus Villigracilis affinis TaxID=3140682 RepID=UPI002A1C9CDB|nr:glycoside hydrolase family 1 protein [Anaerolineales bacterium]